MVMECKKIVLGLLFLSLVFGFSTAKSQVKGVDINLSGDIVSSYVWRGAKAAGASVQPSLTASIGGFSLGAWGSTDIATAGYKEVDFTASYSVAGLTLAVTDYWWDGDDAYRYFSTPEDGYSGHMLEAGLSYTLPQSFPLTLSWNTFFLGEGNKKGNGDNSFSTYVELSYPFSVKGVDMTLATGFCPWESAVYGSDIDGFKFTNVTLGASKEIKITDSFSVPVFTNIIANPAKEDINFVFGITIK